MVAKHANDRHDSDNDNDDADSNVLSVDHSDDKHAKALKQHVGQHDGQHDEQRAAPHEEPVTAAELDVDLDQPVAAAPNGSGQQPQAGGSDISNADLIRMAAEVLQPIEVDHYWIGDIGCALVSENGNIYRGVATDTANGAGFCAERVAIAQMITNKEYRIRKIVAVWNNNPEKQVFVLPPCGVCRQYMFDIFQDMNIEVVMGGEQSILLEDLLPFHDWPEKDLAAIPQ